MPRDPDKTFNTKLPADKDHVGKLQRLWLDVPAPATHLNLGQRWSGDAPFGYHGASLSTAENLFIDVTKRTLFQGHQAITFQTAETWTQYSTGATTVYAKGNVDTTSGTSVFIAAVPAASHDPPCGAHMQANNGDAVPAVASFADLRDTLIGEHKDALDGWSDVADAIGDGKKDLGHEFASSAITDATTNAKGIANSMTHGSSDTSGATHAGIGLVSKDAIGLFSSANVVGFAAGGIAFAAGTSDAEKDFSVFASRDVALRAKGKAELYAKTSAAVEGGTVADVTAKTAVALSARNGAAAVLGKDVFIGSTSPGDQLGSFTGRDASKQKNTDNINLKSAKTTHVESDDKIELKGANKVTITVGNFTIEIQSSGMKIGNVNGQTTVEIKDDNVTISAGPTNQVKVDKSGGVKVASGSNQLLVGPSGVTVNGAQIKLG